VVEEACGRRDAFAAALRDLGLDVPDSQANFLWLPVQKRTSRLPAELAEMGVTVRHFPGEGVRITIGEEEGLARLLTCLVDAQGLVPRPVP
jgi:histidinol-phosphate aminotransferase